MKKEYVYLVSVYISSTGRNEIYLFRSRKDATKFIKEEESTINEDEYIEIELKRMELK